MVFGSATDFDKFSFPFFHIIINKNETQISFIIKAMEKAQKFIEELKFSKELVMKKTFKNKYFAAAEKKILSLVYK